VSTHVNACQRMSTHVNACTDWQVGVMLFQLFAIDVVVGSLSKLVVSAGTYLVFSRLNQPLKAKSEFQLPTELIKVLYQQVFLWLIIPHFPFGVVGALLLWLVQFKGDAFVLKNFNAKPVRPFDAKDTGVYFSIFYLLTFFIFLAWLYYILFLQALPEMDAPCCNLPLLIAIGNSTSEICLAEQTVCLPTPPLLLYVGGGPWPMQLCMLAGRQNTLGCRLATFLGLPLTAFRCLSIHFALARPRREHACACIGVA